MQVKLATHTFESKRHARDTEDNFLLPHLSNRE